jgi:hypothetical protein
VPSALKVKCKCRFTKKYYPGLPIILKCLEFVLRAASLDNYRLAFRRYHVTGCER